MPVEGYLGIRATISGSSRSGIDSRFAARQTVLKRGQLIFGSSGSTIDCIIRDETRFGVLVETAVMTTMPEQIKLRYIGGITLDAICRWAVGTKIGIEFVGLEIDSDINLESTNQIILRTTSIEVFYQAVCDEAVAAGKFVGAAFLVPGIGERLRYEAGAGDGITRLIDALISIESGDPGESDLVHTAFRNGQPCLIFDYLRDTGMRAGSDKLMDLDIGVVVAMPVVNGGTTFGVFIWFLGKSGALTGAVVERIEQMVENVGYTLRRIQREAESDRLRSLVSALSDANEAMLCSRTRETLFQLACESATRGGRFTTAAVLLVEPTTNNLYRVALRGAALVSPAASSPGSTSKLEATHGNSDRHELAIEAINTRRPAVSNDLAADMRLCSFQLPTYFKGAKSAAAVPLFIGSRAIGAFLCASAEHSNFTYEVVDLLKLISINISFALANIARENDEKKGDNRFEDIATYDRLADLPNSRMFNQLLSFSIKAAKRYDRQCAVLCINLDRFTEANSVSGDEVGDAFLVEMASRIRSYVRASDVLALFDKDMFMILLSEITESKKVAEIASDLLAAFKEPINCSGQDRPVTVSIGVAIFPYDGTDPQTLTMNADIAMHRAAVGGGNSVRFFSGDIRKHSADLMGIETDVAGALDWRELCLLYQPVLCLTEGRAIGVAALLHWNHPTQGLIQPSQFIPFAEECSLGGEISRWVLRTACEQNMAWCRAGLMVGAITVDVSLGQILDDTLLADIDAALAKSGMEPKLLRIEITENMVGRNAHHAIRILDELRRRSVSVAFNHFGTDYSRISVAKNFPIDTIKIDCSFVPGLALNSEDKLVALRILTRAKALGLRIIAGGVETIEQAEFLRRHGCQEIQGFLISRPIRADAVSAFLGQSLNLLASLQKTEDLFVRCP